MNYQLKAKCSNSDFVIVSLTEQARKVTLKTCKPYKSFSAPAVPWYAEETRPWLLVGSAIVQAPRNTAVAAVAWTAGRHGISAV